MTSLPAPCSTFSIIFIFNDTATTEIYTLSLHDALPISHFFVSPDDDLFAVFMTQLMGAVGAPFRSEEHTSELQSRFDLVCRLLLEKKNMPRLLALLGLEERNGLDGRLLI